MRDRIKAYVNSKRNEVVSIIKRLAAIPSVEGAPELGAPYGVECRRKLEEAAKILAEYGIASEISDDGYLLAGAVDESKPRIGIFVHGDVVPSGEGWTLTSPFEPLERDGMLIGRGVSDNSTGFTAGLFAWLALRELGSKAAEKIMLFVGSNEESGMGDMHSYVAAHRPPELSIVPDSGFPVTRGEKGICRFFAVSREKCELIRAFEGGEAFNVILGEALVRLPDSDEIRTALERICEESERLTLDSDSGELVLRAVGISKHAARPEGSVNAAKLLCDALLASGILHGTDLKLVETAAELLASNDDLPGANIAAFVPDYGDTTVANGIVELREGRLALSFDVRFVQSDDKPMLEAIKASLDSRGFDLELAESSVGYRHDESDPTVQTMVRVYADCLGIEPPRTSCTGGGSYARCLPNAYLTGTKVYNDAPFELPAGHGAAHQPDEYMSIDGHLAGIAVLAEMLDELGK